MTRSNNMRFLFLIPTLSFAQTWGTVDVYVDLSGASPGAAISTTILNNGTQISTNYSGWALTSPSASLSVGVSQGSLGGAVTVRNGSSYPANHTTQSLAYNNANNFQYATITFNSASGKVVTAAGYVTFGPPNQGSAANLNDNLRIDGDTGAYAVMQLQPGKCGGSGAYGVNIETGPGTISHSPCILINPQTRYLFNLQFNANTNVASLAIFNPVAPFTQVGSTVTVSQVSGVSHLLRSLIGNSEINTAAGTTTYFEHLMFQYTNPQFPLLPSSSVSSNPQPWTGVLDPSRAIDWSSAGVSGGIPSGAWTQCGSTIPAYSGSATTINNAIAACSANQYVQLGAGTFNLTSGIDFAAKPNVALRGAGADQTDLVFSGSASCGGTSSSVCMRSSDINWKSGPTNLANWTAGYAKGTTAITLDSVQNLKVGSPIILDQLNSTQDDGSILVTDSTTALPFTSPGIAGPYSLQGNGGGAQRSGRQQEQIVTVTGCAGVTTAGSLCSGSNVSVTISPGIYMANWTSASSPQAWWATTPALQEGLENVTVDSTSNSQVVGVEIFNCLNCWVKGVRGIDSARAHVQMQYSARTTVRDSYFFLTQNTSTSSYGVECYGGSDALVENNIFQAVASPEVLNGSCSGAVFGYNFSINNYYSSSSLYNQNAKGDHTSGIDTGLYEGNYGNIINVDVIHGTHNLMTYFRNRLTGPQPVCYSSGSSYATATFGTCNNNLQPMSIDAFSRFYNVVGNVLGTTGTNTTYINSGSFPILSLGGGNSANGVTVPQDPNVQTTLMLWGNYDTANAAVRFVSGEVPSALSGTQAAYSNPIPSSQVLPASFYYSSMPSWWPSAKAWPPIGPDVSGGNILGVGGHANTIPAQDCFQNLMGGPSNGTGPVLTFNASACYAPSGTTPPLSPPTGLTVVVH
jgi:hypothetical protein